MEEAATPDAANNIDVGDRDAAAIAVCNTAEVKVTLTPI